MPLFSRKEETGVQSFIVSLLNENCPALRDRLDGPRVEGRVNLTLVLTVVPIEDGRPLSRRAFFRDDEQFSSNGVALVVDRPYGIEEAMLGFRRRGSTIWLRAKARHLHPMGGGFFQLGLRLTEAWKPATVRNWPMWHSSGAVTGRPHAMHGAAQANNLDGDRLIDILVEHVPADEMFEPPAQ